MTQESKFVYSNSTYRDLVPKLAIGATKLFSSKSQLFTL